MIDTRSMGACSGCSILSSYVGDGRQCMGKTPGPVIRTTHATDEKSDAATC